MEHQFLELCFSLQEHRLEIAVVTVLKDSGAEDYLPLFARHRITIETLLQMTDADLKQVYFYIHRLYFTMFIVYDVFIFH